MEFQNKFYAGDGKLFEAFSISGYINKNRMSAGSE